ncbi:E3 ubiquitin-protein ligase MSL2b [Stigmatopora nigra]
MNPVNATSLYVSASRSVLQCDPRDPRALAELCKLLPFFRQSVSCLVCGELLRDPMAPTDSSCQHYVCRGCKGQRMQLKPSCSWCKDYSRFRENRQLSLLVRCYRKLCLYIARSPLAAHIAGAAGDSPDLRAVLDEGARLARSEPDEDPPPSPPDAVAECNGRPASPIQIPPDPGEATGVPRNAGAEAGEPPSLNGPAPDDRHRPRPPSPPRCRRKRSRSESDSEKLRPLPVDSLLRGAAPNYEPPASAPPVAGKGLGSKPAKRGAEHQGAAKKARAPKARVGVHAHPPSHPPSPSKPACKKPAEKKGCKCGRATQNPSVLTCRGQRCPCYSNRKACQNCICRGCQNSYMANGEKKLEAFAVPEKALEQTRLTLGINLSGVAAALRGPPPGAALLNVAAAGSPVAGAFLSAAAAGRSFDESLEMRFDC